MCVCVSELREREREREEGEGDNFTQMYYDFKMSLGNKTNYLIYSLGLFLISIGDLI